MTMPAKQNLEGWQMGGPEQTSIDDQVEVFALRLRRLAVLSANEQRAEFS
ncbi:MAG: hypothetical protein HY261_06240, partial [Chloroflexi bacterium]|nr:hypothetical protein [Chloroflexota bacterium]